MHPALIASLVVIWSAAGMYYSVALPVNASNFWC